MRRLTPPPSLADRFRAPLPRDRRVAWGRPAVAFVLAMCILSGALWFVRWTTAEAHGAGDTFWYSRLALQFSGVPGDEATRRAAEFIVAEIPATAPATWVDLAESIDPRYPAIFAARPVYPLVAAAFVPFVGLDALAVSAWLAGVVFGGALGAVALSVTGSRLAAAAAVVLAYALPTGPWMAFMYADGWMLASWTFVLGCATAYLRGGRGGWLAAFGLALVLLFATKSANGAVLVAAAGLLGGYLLVRRGVGRDRAIPLALVAAVLGLGQLGVSALAGLPGLEVTLQDYFTRHFSMPDVADPVRLLIRRDVNLAPQLFAAMLSDPLPLVVAVLGIVPHLLGRSPAALLWALAGPASVLLVLLHPVSSEIPRLMAPVWVSVALGGALWVATLVDPNRPSMWSSIRAPIPPPEHV